MTERTDLLASIAETIEDYRAGELPKPSPDHVDKWVSQFEGDFQLPILREIDHVLKQTYFSLPHVTTFLRGLIGTKKLIGDDQCGFWRNTNFMDIQQGGNSQREMLALFSEIIREVCAFGTEECGKGSTVFVYLDDGIFTGNRVRRDLEAWVRDVAPARATVHVVCIARHSGGQYYANRQIQEVIQASGKQIDITWWHAIELEDRKAYVNSSDVLRPTAIPDDQAVKAYVAGMRYQPTLRTPGNAGSRNLFSSDSAKMLLEQELLKAGVRIRQMCPNLGDTQRPLGHMTLDTLGFGSLIVTFRNCPNNAPLAFWVGDPWYPLFPRTTNSQTAIKRLFEDLTTAKS